MCAWELIWFPLKEIYDVLEHFFWGFVVGLMLDQINDFWVGDNLGGVNDLSNSF
jgi:hypothetical protein